MTEQLDFDARVEGLVNYWEEIDRIDPAKMEEKPPFYSHGIPVVQAIRDIRDQLVYNVGCHARVEYGKRGFMDTDLHDAYPAELRERAGILSLMTAPPSPEEFFDRARKIKFLFEKIILGDEIRIAQHEHGIWSFPRQNVVVDKKRPIFTVFNSHVSSRELHVQYDRNDVDGLTGPVQNALTVALPVMFEKVLVTYPPPLAGGRRKH